MTKDRSEEKCVVCGSRISTIIDLGMHPFADSFIPYEMETESEPIYPLKCGLCINCGLVQNICLTEPDARYNLYPYSYTSSNSNFAMNHWDAYDDYLSKNNDLANSKIIEIGSNDGYLLGKLISKSKFAIGVDSSSVISDIANRNGIKTINSIFTYGVAKKIRAEYGDFDLVIGNNVFNHSNSPLDFLKGCQLLLSETGKIIFEVPYWPSSLETLKFDQIYHEHVSYFTLKSIDYLAKKTDLQISNFEVVNYHGGSLRVELSRKDSEFENNKVNAQIDWESKMGVYEIEFYSDFVRKVKTRRSEFLQRIHEIIANDDDAKIVLIGAAAKANTFINFYRLDSTIINFITDSSDSKIGKMTPLSRIPILSDSDLRNMGKIYAVITSWNISESLEKKLLQINPEIEYITV